jgi:S-DNA-T family DNA segregation ATPase FtsK/SpoIIIE
MGLGYPKAARFIDMMEQDRIIGPGQGAKPREILVGPEYLEKSGRA